MWFKQIRPNLTKCYSQAYICSDYVWNKEEKFRPGSSRRTLQRSICYFKEAKPWPWHVEFIRGVSVVGLVAHEQLCKVVWGIIIKNFTQTDRQTETQRETERQRERQRQREHKHRSLWVCWSAHRSVCAGNEREIQTGNWRICWLAKALHWAIWVCEQKGGRTAYVCLFDTLCIAYIVTEFCTVSNLWL